MLIPTIADIKMDESLLSLKFQTSSCVASRQSASIVNKMDQSLRFLQLPSAKLMIRSWSHNSNQFMAVISSHDGPDNTPIAMPMTADLGNKELLIGCTKAKKRFMTETTSSSAKRLSKVPCSRPPPYLPCNQMNVD